MVVGCSIFGPVFYIQLNVKILQILTNNAEFQNVSISSLCLRQLFRSSKLCVCMCVCSWVKDDGYESCYLRGPLCKLPRYRLHLNDCTAAIYSMEC